MTGLGRKELGPRSKSRSQLGRPSFADQGSMALVGTGARGVGEEGDMRAMSTPSIVGQAGEREGGGGGRTLLLPACYLGSWRLESSSSSGAARQAPGALLTLGRVFFAIVNWAECDV